MIGFDSWLGEGWPYIVHFRLSLTTSCHLWVMHNTSHSQKREILRWKSSSVGIFISSSVNPGLREKASGVGVCWKVGHPPRPPLHCDPQWSVNFPSRRAHVEAFFISKVDLHSRVGRQLFAFDVEPHSVWSLSVLLRGWENFPSDAKSSRVTIAQARNVRMKDSVRLIEWCRKERDPRTIDG